MVLKKRNRLIECVEYVMLKARGRFVCWDSYKSKWFIGPKRLSEIFLPDTSLISEAQKAFPDAIVVSGVSSVPTDNYCFAIEGYRDLDLSKKDEQRWYQSIDD